MGGDVPCGAYVLRVDIARPVTVTFGRFRGGEAVPVPAGSYSYVGSAMGRSGSTTLARRLLRHASRADGRPHEIMPELLQAMQEAGFGSTEPPASKRLHWNVDHLLEREHAEITGVWAVRTYRCVEEPLARFIENDACTSPLLPGLGAADDPGATHLLRVDAGEDWWRSLGPRVEQLAGG